MVVYHLVETNIIIQKDPKNHLYEIEALSYRVNNDLFVQCYLKAAHLLYYIVFTILYLWMRTNTQV